MALPDDSCLMDRLALARSLARSLFLCCAKDAIPRLDSPYLAPSPLSLIIKESTTTTAGCTALKLTIGKGAKVPFRAGRQTRQDSGRLEYSSIKKYEGNAARDVEEEMRWKVGEGRR